MPTPEITFESVLPAGDAIKPEIHPDNKKVLQDEIEQRIERQEHKINRWALWRARRKRETLKRQLQKAKYNQLCNQRLVVYEQCIAIEDEYRKSKHRTKKQRLRNQYKAHRRQFRALSTKIESLSPILNEFEAVNAKIQSHEDVLQLEREEAENFEAFKREARVWEKQIKSTFRQSRRLHHKGERANGKTFTDIPEIDHIIIKEDKVYYRIKTSTQNALQRMFGTWTNALPYGVDVSDLICDETLQNLSAACGRVVQIAHSERGTSINYVVNRFDSPDGIPRRVLYQSMIDWYPVKDHTKTPWCAGVSDDRKIKWFNFEQYPHVLIAGATQGGKSNLVNGMIAGISSMNTPDEVRVSLIDLKGAIEFTHWENLKHQIGKIASTPSSVLDELKRLHNLMERRLTAFKLMKAKNLASYNEKSPKRFPRIIVFVDEMATLIGLGDMTSAIHDELRVLSAQGRAVGIHLVLCTQHSSVDVIPGWVKTNMSLRVSAKMPTHQSSMIIIDTITAALLPNIPGRMVFSAGREEMICQSPYISDNEISKAVKLSADFVAPNDEEFKSNYILPTREKFGRDDVLRYAIEEFNGKLSANRIHDEVGNETITLRALRAIVARIRDDIENNGFVTYNDNRYEYVKDGRAYILKMISEGTVEHENVPETIENHVPSDVPSQKVA